MMEITVHNQFCFQYYLINFPLVCYNIKVLYCIKAGVLLEFNLKHRYFWNK